MNITKQRYFELHRQARLQNLGTLACTLPREQYDYFLHEVYDLRFPCVNIQPQSYWKRGFDRLRAPIRKWQTFGHCRVY